MPRYAAVDIGSNSLRLEVAEISAADGADPERGGQMRVLASEREVTRLGESVFRSGRISPEAMAANCAVLARLARTWQKLDVDGIRVVATSAVRDARNQEEFVTRASEAVGGKVEIISGAEEARLINLGVVWRWPHHGKRVLILDIGGGSAELIFSESGKLVEAFSKPLGAVRLKELFLKSDPAAQAELHRMNEYITEKVAAAVRRMGGLPLDRVIGTSASALAVVSAVNRLPQDERDKADRLRATSAQVRKLYEKVAERDLDGRRRVAGIGPRRAEIIVPGVAVLRRVLQDFRQRAFYYCLAGVRDGIIADLFLRGVGRERSMLDRDQRRVVEQTARHYAVDLAHARKVAEYAHTLFTSLETVHGLPRNCGKLLQAAALLMDAGHYVSDTRHHRHSYYLVAHSALPGFTDSERLVIANLCRYHRKSMPAGEHLEFRALGPEERKWVVQLAPLLRLADALDRSRKQPVNRLSCRLREGLIEVRLESAGDIDLEAWAAEQSAAVFREVFERRLAIIKEAA